MRSAWVDNHSLSEMTEALLHRKAPVIYGDEARRMVRGRRVLITGAAGSIGSELVRQVHALSPERLFLLDHDESGMHQVQLELQGHGLFDDDSAILCDIRDATAIAAILSEVRPDIIFHAAAHKHLPLLERYPAEGVKTNVLGTLNLVVAACHAGVGRFVNISTDKAASPTSVLGATKRLAELVAASYAGTIEIASVRFGNVLGSRGSFLQSLAAQVANGYPITITHPDVSRFFMTIPEAAGLVIEAGVMASGGETYVLDMGDPVKIIDVVHRYLEYVGAPGHQISFTGLRPGEKMHEALFDAAELGQATKHARIAAVRQRVEDTQRIGSLVDELASTSLSMRPGDLRTMLASMTPSAAGEHALARRELQAV